MTHSIVLSNPQQAHQIVNQSWAWIKGRLLQGKKVTLTLAEEKRTLPQNDHIHPVIRRIAKAIGRPTDDESLRKLRLLMLEQWMNDTSRPPILERSLDGLRWVVVSKGTSDLDKPDCAEFIDYITAEEAKLYA